jgi:hypothetical protein
MDTGSDFCHANPPVRIYSNKNHYDLENRGWSISSNTRFDRKATQTFWDHFNHVVLIQISFFDMLN